MSTAAVECRIEERDRAWAERAWQRALVGLDQMAAFGNVGPLRAEELYAALIAGDEEAGLLWVRRRFTTSGTVRSFGDIAFPEFRGRRRVGLAFDVVPWLFRRFPETLTIVALAYGSNPRSVNTLRHHAHLRSAGQIDDAGGPGVHLYIFQARRADVIAP